MSLESVATKVTASEVDIDLEVRSSSEYLEYWIERAMRKEIAKVGTSLCKMNRHSMLQAELSPFHEDALLRVRGEVLQELRCTPVQVEVREGDKRSEKCHSDAMPAWLDGAPVYVQAATHLILGKNEMAEVTCSSLYTPIFRSDDGVLLQANPSV